MKIQDTINALNEVERAPGIINIDFSRMSQHPGWSIHMSEDVFREQFKTFKTSKHCKKYDKISVISDDVQVFALTIKEK